MQHAACPQQRRRRKHAAVHRAEPLERRMLLAFAAAGSEFSVNSFTPGLQYRPAVASDADGDSVVVWESDGQDAAGSEVYARMYGADGTPRGGEFRVNRSEERRVGKGCR